jgi:hypothetical protein
MGAATPHVEHRGHGEQQCYAPYESKPWILACWATVAGQKGKKPWGCFGSTARWSYGISTLHWRLRSRLS